MEIVTRGQCWRRCVVGRGDGTDGRSDPDYVHHYRRKLDGRSRMGTGLYL